MRVHALTLASICSASNQFMYNGPDPYQQVPYPYFLPYQGRQVAPPTPPQVSQVHVAVNPIQGGDGFPYRSATPGGNYPEPVLGLQDGNYPERMAFPGYGKAPPVEGPRAEAPRSIQYVVHRHTIAHTYDKGSPVIKELDKRITTLEGMVRRETNEVEGEAREIGALKKSWVEQRGGMQAEVDKLQQTVRQLFSKLQEVVAREKEINENHLQVVDVLLNELNDMEAKFIASLRRWPAWVDQDVAGVARKSPGIDRNQMRDFIIHRIRETEEGIIRKLQQEYVSLLEELKIALSEGGGSPLHVKEVAAESIKEMARDTMRKLSQIINKELHRIMEALLHSEAKRKAEIIQRAPKPVPGAVTIAKKDPGAAYAAPRRQFAKDSRNILGDPKSGTESEGGDEEEEDDDEEEDGEKEGDDDEDDDDEDDEDDDDEDDDDDCDDEDEDEDDEDAKPKKQKNKACVTSANKGFNGTRKQITNVGFNAGKQ